MRIFLPVSCLLIEAVLLSIRDSRRECYATEHQDATVPKINPFPNGNGANNEFEKNTNHSVRCIL